MCCSRGGTAHLLINGLVMLLESVLVGLKCGKEVSLSEPEATLAYNHETPKSPTEVSALKMNYG